MNFMEKRLTVALVAHDAMKHDLAEWVAWNWEKLLSHRLICTGTTGRIVAETLMERRVKDTANTRFDITMLKSGPLGGDQQIGAMIAEGKLDVLIFFCDNLITQGHQQDVGALTRLASLYNIAFATNRTTADMIITSSLFGSEEYERVIPQSIKSYENRKLTFK